MSNPTEGMDESVHNGETETHPAVHRFLDISTGHLPEAERVGLESGELLDNKTPRVIRHTYGWWVNVPEEIDEEEDFADAPALLAAVRFAQGLECVWINFDVDAAQVDGLTWYGEGDA